MNIYANMMAINTNWEFGTIHFLPDVLIVDVFYNDCCSVYCKRSVDHPLILKFLQKILREEKDGK